MNARSVKPKAPKPSRPVCIVVLGMHRSGTSALTRVLSLLGCDLPKTILAANWSNEAGHWESEAIYRLNEKILASAGSSWHDWTEFNAGWFRSPRAEEFHEEALAVVSAEFGASRLFVLKDPRICRIVPFWLDVIEGAGARPLIVFALRNPQEVALSLQKRDGFELSMGHLLWLRHVLDGEFASRGTPRFFAGYDRLIAGWGRIAAEVQSALGVTWPRMSDHVAAEVDSFLSRSHRHHQEADRDIIENPTLPLWLREAFQILAKWAEAGEDSHDFVRLDQIRAEFNAAAPAFSRLIAAAQTNARRLAHLEQALVEAEAKLRKAEAASAAEQARANRLESEVAAARQRLERKEQQIVRPKGPGEAKHAVTGQADAVPRSATGRVDEPKGLAAVRSSSG